tara:strand:- start:4587 stop:5180 length:594 start_codon:yes stop_codon:yes gene_type:complete
VKHRRGRRRLPILRLFILAVSVGFFVWAAGFYRFAQLIPEPTPRSEVATDAIVVLTGGTRRVGEGLSLLERGLGKKLFVSGVYRGVDVQELLKIARRAPGNLKCCIALGYAADNTRGNAEETADWIRREKITSIRIVTASYHMPRSLLEFRQVLPAGITIVPHPVFPGGFSTESWWRDVNALKLAISEYHKYLLACL